MDLYLCCHNYFPVLHLSVIDSLLIVYVVTAFAIVIPFSSSDANFTTSLAFTVSSCPLDSGASIYMLFPFRYAYFYKKQYITIYFTSLQRVHCIFVLNYLFLQVGKACAYCKEEVKDSDALIDLCKTPLHFACSKASRKLFIAEVERIQDERHAKFGAKAKVEQEKNAAKRKAVSCRPPRHRLGIDLRV